MTAVDIEARREWLLKRRQGIGASDVAAIGSVPGAFGSPYSIWADKCGLLPVDEVLDDDDPRIFGTDLEDLIVRRFERATNLYVGQRQQLLRYPEFERWFATIDGLVWEEDGAVDVIAALGVFESKYTADPPWPTIPEHYQWQLQWQMMCTGHRHAWLAALFLPFGRPRFRVYEVDRDDQLIDRIEATVAHFWNEYVITGDSPPLDDHPATARTIDELFAHLETTKVPTLALDDYAELVDRWVHWRTQRLDAEKHEKHAASQLKAVFGAENPVLSEGTVDGELAVSWRSRPNVQFDVPGFRRDHPDLAEQYTNRGTTRVLLPHGRHLK